MYSGGGGPVRCFARANKEKSGVPEDEIERAKLAFQDLTDAQNPYFRYLL